MLNDQDNQKNLLLAIVLSVGVLLAWQVFYAGPKLKDDQERRQRIQQEQSQVKEQPGGAENRPRHRARRSSRSRAPWYRRRLPQRQPLRATQRYRRPHVCASRPLVCAARSLLQGGRIDDLVLAKYRETVAPQIAQVVLFSPSGAPHPTTPSTDGRPGLA